MKFKFFAALAIFAIAAVINFTVLQDDFSWDNLFTSNEAAGDQEADYDMAASRASVARINMEVDTSFLSEEERQVINRLNKVGDLMSEIYLRQVSVNNPAVRAEIAASDRADKDALLDMFDLHFGPWDTLKEGHPFYGDVPQPAGAGFYPTDMTKEEFEGWIADHPDD